MNPAPTLVSDWVTPEAMWIVVAAFVVIGMGVILGRIVNADRFKAMPEPVHPIHPRDICDLENCQRPAVLVFDAGNLDGLLYICSTHAGRVSKWAPLSDTPYNQDEAS